MVSLNLDRSTPKLPKPKKRRFRLKIPKNEEMKLPPVLDPKKCALKW